jgi:hypothetical protein
MVSFWGADRPAPRRKKIPKAVHDMVWIKYMKSKTDGKCYCCRTRTITIYDFEVGHNKAVATGGKDNLDNLRPICKSCNTSMQTQTIESFRAKHFAKPGTLSPEMKLKQAKAQVKQKLEHLTLPQLKALATKHGVRVPGYVEEGLFGSRRVAPTKSEYIKKLSAVVTPADLGSPAVPKARVRR